MGIFKKTIEFRDVESSIVGIPVPTLPLKEYAIDICANYVARVFSQSHFVIDHKQWSYRLNVKPNENQSGAEFWREVIFRLYKEGEALVVLTDHNMLVLADSWEEEEYKLYRNIYRGITVGDYTFKRVFYADEVLHFRLNNEKLALFTASIYKDYEELISTMISSSKVSNQLRFKFNVPRFDMGADEWKIYDLLTEELKQKIASSTIVGIPDNKTFEYEEVNKPDKQATDINPIEDAVWGVVDKVAVMIGIPPVLLHGTVAGSSEAQKLFIINCLEPLNQLIEDEINAKIFKESSYIEDQALHIMGANRPNIFEMAESVDKLVSSGAFNRNEIRQLLGYDPVDGLEEFMITKNYMTNHDSLKGGEGDGEEVL